MRKTLFYTFIILISAGLLIYFYTANKEKQTESKLESFQIQNQPQYVKPKEFDDGLENPEKIETFDWGTRSDGVVEIRTYMFDINGDKLKDKITKTRYENGTRLGFWDYKIEIATGNAWKDITPDGLNTAEDVDCDLQRIQFSFLPFKIKKVWREIETDWDMPSIAFIVNYELKNGVLVGTQPRKANVVCDVKVLF